MNFRTTAVLSALVVLGQGLPVRAQATDKAKAKKPAAAAPAPAKVKDSLEAQFARQNLKQVLDAVNNAWFGKPLRRDHGRRPPGHHDHRPHRRRHERQGGPGGARGPCRAA